MRRSYLKRKTPLMRGKMAFKQRKPIKQVSTRRRRESALYARLRIEFLGENEFCEVCHKAHAVEVHHKLGRTGLNYLNKTTWAPVCHACHEWIENNKAEARERGFLGNKHTGRLGDGAGNCQNVFQSAPRPD